MATLDPNAAPTRRERKMREIEEVRESTERTVKRRRSALGVGADKAMSYPTSALAVRPPTA